MLPCLPRSLSFLFAILSMNAYSQNDYAPSAFSDPHRLERIQKALPTIAHIYQTYAKKNHFPGFAFGIMVDGNLVYAGAEGALDLERNQAANQHSMFRIASMTKSLTAMAILKLRDEGKLKLDDPVVLYIPELQNQKITADSPNITIRDLLTHSAGFPLDNAWGDRQLHMSTDDLIVLLKNGLSFSNIPGVAYEYSNLGFVLLGLVIDRVAGISYQDYIEKHIWLPLKMKDVSWDFSKVDAQVLVQGYQWNRGKWDKETMLSDGAFGAMGGMIASLDAFSHYVGFHQTAWPPRNDQETGPIKRSSVREMQQAWRFHETTPYKYLNGQKCALTTAYGYGLKWVQDCKGRTYVGHSGGLPGFGSNWFIMPEYGIGVMLFANATYAPTADINLLVLDELIKAAQLKPRHYASSVLLKEKQAALVRLLQNWTLANATNLVADNFFLDTSLDARKKESLSLFKKAGNIIRVQDIMPDNQLSGSFIMEGEKADLKISFMLTPQTPALIQTLQITLLPKNKI